MYQIEASWTFGGTSGPPASSSRTLVVRILGQPVRDDGAGGAGPDDDVVELGHVGQPSFWSRNGRNGTLSWKFAM